MKIKETYSNLYERRDFMWKKIFCWLLVIIWLFVIFSFSAKNGASSDVQSRTFIINFANNFASVAKKIGIIKNMPTNEQINNFAYDINPFIRKCAHATVYFILAILILLALNTNKETFFRNIGIAIVICFLYALTDEYHQTTIPGRTGKFVDCIVDTIGGVIACLLYYPFLKLKDKQKE